MSLDYFKELHSLYKDWLVHKMQPLPSAVIVIDADLDMNMMKAEFTRLKKQIFEMQRDMNAMQRSGLATMRVAQSMHYSETMELAFSSNYPCPQNV